jgi:RNA polymerase sigma-70 factor (ECF subfamily)
MSSHDVTRLLHLAATGDPNAANELLPLVYERLRAVANGYFRGRADQTLQPTALVHEAFLRLVAQEEGAIKDREHFSAVAATAMRQILADRARRRGAQKRGGDRERIALEDVQAADPKESDDADLVALHEALEKLEAIDPRRAKVIELRFLGGLSVEATARHLNVSERTVEADWRAARAWLKTQLGSE